MHQPDELPRDCLRWQTTEGQEEQEEIPWKAKAHHGIYHPEVPGEGWHQRWHVQLCGGTGTTCSDLTKSLGWCTEISVLSED